MTNRLGGAAVVVVLAAACGRGVTAGPPAPSPNPAAAGTAAPAAAARPDTAPQPTAAASPAAPSNAGGTETAAEFEALYKARADSARLKVSPADVAFMQGMIHHHAQAIVMSRLAPSHGASASVQTLAARIINAQQDEIRTMQNWLRDRVQAVPQLDASGNVTMGAGSGAAMGGMRMGHDSAKAGTHHDMAGMAMGQGSGASQGMALMPGMLTPEQMEQLRRARGAEFDHLFLTYMIQHHSGAITMVNDLFATDGAARDQLVFKLASDVQVDQTTEIARMRRMLTVMELSGR